MARTTDYVDGTLYKVLHRSARKPGNAAVVQAVEVLAVLNNGRVSADQVRTVALNAARDEFKREGVSRPSEDKVRARAYWGAAIAAEEQPFTLAEDTRAPAKAIHFLVSGAISARVASWLPFLPESVRHRVGLFVAHLIGVVKEIADQLKGTGYNHDDIKTDDAGARASLK